MTAGTMGRTSCRQVTGNGDPCPGTLVRLDTVDGMLAECDVCGARDLAGRDPLYRVLPDIRARIADARARKSGQDVRRPLDRDELDALDVEVGPELGDVPSRAAEHDESFARAKHDASPRTSTDGSELDTFDEPACNHGRHGACVECDADAELDPGRPF